MIFLKSKHEIEIMKKAAKILKEVLKEVEKAANPGTSTLEIDRIAQKIATASRRSFSTLYGC